MIRHRVRQGPWRNWFAAYGKYLLLVGVASITAFLVVLAFAHVAA